LAPWGLTGYTKPCKLPPLDGVALEPVRRHMVARAKTKGGILDAIFKDPETKHGLKIFSVQELEGLDLEEDGGRYYIKCAVSQKKRLAKPEEVVRQLTINKLARDLGYPLARMDVEVPIKMGSAYASKAADIVVYKEPTRETPYIIIEVKKPRRKDGLDQLHSYMNATGVPYGAWLNGNDAVWLFRREPNLFEYIGRLPAVTEDIDDVRSPIVKGELQPIGDLKQEVQELENTVLANAGLSAFDGVFPLLFAKLWDEFDKGLGDPMDFRTTTAEPREQAKRFQGVFRRALAKWRDVLNENDWPDISPEALVTIVSAVERLAFLDADLDVIDAAFEYMVNPEQKADKGQFFTPRPIVKMAVKMLNPKPDELAIDPACGPCGFMIHSLHWVTERYLKGKYGDQWRSYSTSYARSNLFALDYDPKLVKVARFMMLIAGDGRSNVYRVSSLDPREWQGRSDGLVGGVPDGKFDVLMTNPPFAGKIAHPEILGTYDLSYKGDPARHHRANRMTRDVLFLERCLRFLKPGGRMAIVLPQGNLNNTSAEYIRRWVMEKARVLAVVGLHVNTFKPFTGTKTSVLFLRKWREGEEPLEDYPILLAVNEKPVRDNSGNYVFKRNADGSYATDAEGKRVIDHDLDDIAEGFVGFARDQGFEFWGD